MSITYNGVSINTVSYNGTTSNTVTYNGTEVFNSQVEALFPSAEKDSGGLSVVRMEDSSNNTLIINGTQKQNGTVISITCSEASPYRRPQQAFCGENVYSWYKPVASCNGTTELHWIKITFAFDITLEQVTIRDRFAVANQQQSSPTGIVDGEIWANSSASATSAEHKCTIANRSQTGLSIHSASQFTNSLASASNIRCVWIRGTKWANWSHHEIGEISIKFKARRSDLPSEWAALL